MLGYIRDAIYRLKRAVHQLIVEMYPRAFLNEDEITGEFLRAMHQYNFEKALRYIHNGANPNYADGMDSGNTILIKAVGYGILDHVKRLLDAGANVNYPNNYGDTPLIHAAQRGHANIVELLLDAGANVNHISSYHRGTALIAANDIDTIKLLLDAGADVNHANINERTALFAAAEHGDVNIVMLILTTTRRIIINQFFLNALENGNLNTECAALIREYIKRRNEQAIIALGEAMILRSKAGAPFLPRGPYWGPGDGATPTLLHDMLNGPSTPKIGGPG